MTERLIEGNIEGAAYDYDPFANPPDMALARTHRQATMVGITDPNFKPRLCPCCDNIVNKKSLHVCFKDEQLLPMGVGYPLYYKITKYFFLILLGIFFISGGAMYFLMTFHCSSSEKCLTLFGIPIVDISIAEQHNLDRTEVLNTITAIGIFICVLYLKTVINEDIRVLTVKKNCPSIYTIMLQNVPDV
jgi:hypothetical protein